MEWKDVTSEMYEMPTIFLMPTISLISTNAYLKGEKSIKRSGSGYEEDSEEEGQNGMPKGKISFTPGLTNYLEGKGVDAQEFLRRVTPYIETLVIRRYVYVLGNEEGSFTLMPTLPQTFRKVGDELEIEEDKDYESWETILDEEIGDIDRHSPYR